MIDAVEFVDIDWDGRPVTIEYRWINASSDQPLIVFLHEGLGSMSMWKDFPDRLCQASRCRGLVYSRPGYGESTPRRPDENWGVDFMHRQAYAVLPVLLEALGIDVTNAPPWLFGHSDGASIAMLYAAAFPGNATGVIALAPHILVEDLTVRSIEQARESYRTTDLKQKLGRYHRDPDSAFWGWNDIWLHEGFRDWNIETEIASIECPLLAVQGIDDEYGTLQQVDGIVQQLAGAQVVKLANCGHSPHRDQPAALLHEVTEFIDSRQGAERLPVIETGAGNSGLSGSQRDTT